jgi:hypothetical protein
MRLTVSLRVARVMASSVGCRPRAGLVEPLRDLRRHHAVAHGVEHELELLLVLAMDHLFSSKMRSSVSSHTFASKNHMER